MLPNEITEQTTVYPLVRDGYRFIPLPSNPAELTAEHARLAFAGNVEAGLREILRLGLERARSVSHEHDI